MNEGTNSTSSLSMFIGVVIAEEGEIIMALVFVQLIDIPTLDASLLILRIYLFLINLNYFNCLFTALMDFLSDSMTF